MHPGSNVQAAVTPTVLVARLTPSAAVLHGEIQLPYGYTSQQPAVARLIWVNVKEVAQMVS
jgi:hypothetical protein